MILFPMTICLTIRQNIKELAQEESCVIVGRAADYILKDYDNVVKVFVHAPIKDCIKTLKEMTGKNRKKKSKSKLLLLISTGPNITNIIPVEIGKMQKIMICV